VPALAGSPCLGISAAEWFEAAVVDVPDIDLFDANVLCEGDQLVERALVILGLATELDRHAPGSNFLGRFQPGPRELGRLGFRVLARRHTVEVVPVLGALVQAARVSVALVRSRPPGFVLTQPG
jgi:hypothetical protein